MRNGQNKRMRGRNRNKPHHGGHHHNPLTRVYESNGPDVKIRGTAHHITEKYLQLARDAQTSGDPVTAENNFQHAEHYYRLIAAAQEQLRQQNPYYQPQAMPGEGNRDESFDGDDEDPGQPTQGQPTQGQPTQGQPSFGGQQQPYPPREQPQPYGGQQPPQQSRPQQPQPYQQYQPQLQPTQPPQPPAQPAVVDVSDGERLPSFITGTQPPQSPQDSGPNGHDNQGGDRFPRHRRRRHRGPGDPRTDMTNVPQNVRGDDGPDDSPPGNS
ncbi:MAG: DUF4167 domain-containing protein [Xanthobacteraceae bacterium]